MTIKETVDYYFNYLAAGIEDVKHKPHLADAIVSHIARLEPEIEEDDIRELVADKFEEGQQ